MSVDNTIKDRETKHGPYWSGALIADQLIETMGVTPGWKNLSANHRYVLIMIQVKISRILNGNPCEAEHWHDIQGYARLVEKSLHG